MPNRIITSMFCAAVAIAAIAQTETPDSTITQEPNAIIGRPYKLFDTTAFCSYSSFHPSQYLTDNNWDILLRVCSARNCRQIRFARHTV